MLWSRYNFLLKPSSSRLFAEIVFLSVIYIHAEVLYLISYFMMFFFYNILYQDAARYRDELKEIAPYSLLKCSSDATTLV